jgi:hypothetical protein
LIAPPFGYWAIKKDMRKGFIFRVTDISYTADGTLSTYRVVKMGNSRVNPKQVVNKFKQKSCKPTRQIVKAPSSQEYFETKVLRPSYFRQIAKSFDILQVFKFFLIFYRLH